MTKKMTPEALIHSHIMQGKLDTNGIMEAVAKAHPDFVMTNRTISFHRTLLRKLGHNVPRSGRNDKGATRGPSKPRAKTPAKTKAAVGKRPAAKKATEKKAPAKRAPAKAKAPAKKPAAKRAAAKKAPAKRAAAKKPAARKAPAKKKAAAKRKSATSKRGAKG